jgi:hypothetical protein
LDALFGLVSRLLTKMLSEGAEQLIISVKSDNCIYDLGTTIEITDPARLLIDRAFLKENGFRTEISISAAMTGQGATRHPCSLYFILNRNIHVAPRKSRQVEGIDGKCMTLTMRRSSEKFHDAIFHLVLKGFNNHGEQYSLSEGKGYLLFER